MRLPHLDPPWTLAVGTGVGYLLLLGLLTAALFVLPYLLFRVL